MNIFEILKKPELKKPEKNENILPEIRQYNNKKISQLNNKLSKDFGKTVNEETIHILGTKRLLDCYDYNEIIYILKHYKILPGDKK